MKRWVEAAALLTALTAAAGVAPANASVSFVRTEVYWEGAFCIDVTLSNGVTKAVCNPNGHYTYTEGNVWPGDAIGADPIMGSASWLGCTMYVDGVVAWRSAAYAGDGYDANCLRIKT